MSSWRPNWKDATAYPIDLTRTEWRWEFLRRCDDYQADFEHYRSVMLKEAPLPHTPPSFWQGFYERCADMPGCAKKYGVNFLYDPAEPEQPGGSFFIMTYPYGVGAESRDRTKEREAEHAVKIAFDLKKPLPKQLEEAKQYLHRLQGKPTDQRDPKPKLWARYLRVLDAKAAHATHRDIAKILELQPSKKADGYAPDRLVSETLKQARALQLRFKAPS